MDYYILDENDCPQLVDMMDYYAWQKQLPDAIRTGFGFTLQFTQTESVTISTVYLGLDHSFGGLPVLWETMVFCDGENNETCERSKTRAEALETHRRFCKKYIGLVAVDTAPTDAKIQSTLGRADEKITPGQPDIDRP